ncbi:Homeobox-leucine zipper protein HDG11 [Escovopsis weberi]|uniref:Homeobox-leucine zipper protein HDG11 n=1 Tax=Escovopsis weberi TaxID=150374 RepID=A0A0M8MTJ2_ESCWE|nr:Homeobox-leucine zipper protein HDG11 [Escovopsis weberi]
MGPGDAAEASAASAQPNSISSLIQSSSSSRGYSTDDHNHVSCSKENVDVDEEDVIEGEAEASQPLTTAERVAARRKMKRFRLTHQQTRFLSSEFAKQPHPDAAHRERLSREIPGLSPRQVQVWFQNRRAKIKRHNAEDRERMIKMRAVPDDFDNVQALHSPYGAMNMPMAPSVDFTSPSYANSMMRPLMVDVRRQDGNDQISPTGISPSYSHIGYNPPTSMNSSGVISALSPASNDRYTHSSHSTSALGGSHGPLDSALQANRAAMRPIQSFSSIRDVMSRPRSESLQSPLRPGISWKTESMDYYVYGGLNSSSQTMTDRPSLYSPFPSTSQNGPRLRAASASSISMGMDHQYRDIGGSGLHSPGQGGHGRPTGASSHYSGSSAYTTSYTPTSASAPLDTSQSRPSSTPSNVRDYPDTPLHVGSAPANEFPQIMHAGMSAQDNPRSEVRDLYHNGSSLEYGHTHDRSDHYSSDLAAHSFKRERSYTLSGAQTASVGDTRAQPQGSTA